MPRQHTDLTATDPARILGEVFGFPAFRGLQAEIVRHVCAGGDALVLMPTGGGKSLCYQVPALVRPGTAVVVSPLIALMADQVAALTQLGVRAAALNSALAPAEARQVERALAAGELDLIYVAPERLLTEAFLARLDDIRLALFAIDEAHCVSEWGHDFRPEYRQLTLLHQRYPEVPRIALTATADEVTRADIVERLELGQGRIFVAGFDRPNIRYTVLPKDNPRGQLERFLKAGHKGDSGIVYCLSRRRVEETAAWLSARGFPALAYHAGLEADVRAERQRRFRQEEGLVMVATIAFGMGIDKPDVRFVAHLDLPRSLEAYYQETGRAGRDGLPADAWMAYGMQDAGVLRHFIDASEAEPRQKQVEHRKLNALLGYCESARCRRQVLLEYFGERLAEPCGNCDACLEPVESFDGTEAARMALSAVYRTGERFGAAHLVDVLTGKENERIRRFGHDRLATFGVGSAYSAKQWRSIFRQLVAQGLLLVDVAGHGGLRLGADVRPVLRGERRVELRHDPAAARAPKARPARAAPELDAPDDEALFQKLRAWRREAANAQGVPPYVVFHDATLLAVVQARPRSTADLAGLPGIGGAKRDRYGAGLIDVVAAHDSGADTDASADTSRGKS
jgi:ATP-dependent DNA helicase RecQ